jgi:hypothetical protein
LSFLDEPDQPRARPPRRPPPPRGPGVDHQTLVARRVVAGSVGLVVVLVLFFGVRACLDARKAQSFEDYVVDVGALVDESNQQGAAFFDLLEQPGVQGSSVDLENTVNGYRVEAEQLLERARGIETPSQLSEAQRYLIEALSFRSDGLRGVADQLPAALGDEGHREAALAIAGQMQNFLASDVLYSQRVIPRIQTAARDEDLLERIGTLPESQFLPDIKWLDQKTVLGAIEAIRTGQTTTADEDVAAGLHGTGLQSVTVLPGEQALTEGGVNSITETEDLAFEVAVQNQGENDERNVAIRIAIQGGTAPIELSGEVGQINEGETVSAEIPLTETPPTNQELTVDVEVEPVPGEESADNNSAKYLVRFGA